MLTLALACIPNNNVVKGGDAVWGDSTWAPDDLDNRDHTHGDLIAFRDSVIKAAGEDSLANMTADTVSPWILAHTPTHFQKMVATNYSYGIERDEEKLKENNLDYRKWSNPLEVQCVGLS